LGGTWRGDTLPGTLMDIFLHVYLGSFFLDPEDVKKLKIEVIWNISKGTGLL
jgi:hypothetical protein